MKNLKLFSVDLTKLSIEGSHFAMCDCYFYFIKEGVLYRSDLSKYSQIERLSETIFENVVAIEILNLERKVIVALETQLWVYCTNVKKEQLIELPKQLANMKFNCSESCVAIVYTDNSLGTYYIDFIDAQLIDHDVSSLDAEVHQRVYTGWGSETTQFRGSQGKYKPEPKPNVCPVTDKKPTISWRGNDEMFVVNYWESDQRFFKVFTLPCQPLYQSYEAHGLQPVLAWRPQGNTIACSVFTNDTYKIEFYEKNGYVFKKIDLIAPNEVVAEMKWSNCSNILAVKQVMEDGGCRLSLYGEENAVYVLKQHLLFPKERKVLFFNFRYTFMSQIQIVMTVVTSDVVLTYTFGFGFDRSLSSQYVAVIRGRSVDVTDYGKGHRPPPTCDVHFTSGLPLNFIAFHPEKPICAVNDASDTLHLVSLDESSERASEVIWKTIDTEIMPLTHRNFYWFNDKLYFLVESYDNKQYLHELNTRTGESNICSEFWNLLQIIPVHDMNSLVLIYPKKIDVMKDKSIISTYLSGVTALDVQVKVINEELFLFMLGIDGNLYLNTAIIYGNVTSYVISDEYLFVTTSSNRLISVPFTVEQAYTFISKFDIPTGLFSSRNIEQGAQVISVCKDKADVVLWVPRGNTETVFSDMVAVDIIDKMLQKNQWKEAISYVRTCKLNANLLFDLNPARFLDHIPDIINSCAPSALNSIIVQFTNENFLKAKYHRSTDGNNSEYPNKVHAIFENMLKAFEEMDYAYYMETIIVICVYNFNLRKALEYMQDVLHRLTERDEMRRIAEESVRLLKHYSQNDTNLYNEALLLYDLKLAKYIATLCQMDPMIYERELTELENMSPIECRFAINQMHNRYDVAVTYLLRIKEKNANDVISYVKQHNLIKQAYKSCNSNSPYYIDVVVTYADHLSHKGLHNEAGLVLARAGIFERAIEEYTTGLNTVNVVRILDKVEFSSEKKRSVYSVLATKLSESNKFLEASEIYNNYLGDIESAIRVLLKGYCFSKVLQLSEKNSSIRHLDQTILEEFEKYMSLLSDRVRDVNCKFSKYADRLKTLRTNLKKSYESGQSECFIGRRDDSFSDVETSSNYSRQSRSSRLSTLSSRNRRKEQRKMTDLKEGGVYEDIALIRALYDVCNEVEALTRDVVSACQMSLEYTELSAGTANALYSQLDKLISEVRERVKEIWPESIYQICQNKTSTELAILGNIDCLNAKYRVPPEISYSDPLGYIFK